MVERAISLHFRQYSDRPGLVVDSRTKREYPIEDPDTKILVYEDRVIGWFLRYGQILQEHHDAAFVVLQVALAQIEGIEQYRRGVSSDRQSCDFFCSAMKRVFSLTGAVDQKLKDFYGLARCGLFHDGMTRPGVSIENRFDQALEFDGDNIKISPNKFLDAVSNYFAAYIAQLKEPVNAELRSAFEKKWNEKFDRDKQVANPAAVRRTPGGRADGNRKQRGPRRSPP